MVVIRRISCDEELPALGEVTVGDFWSWAYSDVQNNTDRAILSEFLVGQALGVTKGTRIGWDDFDLLYQEKWRIEVKSSAYLQSKSWESGELPRKLSRISFDLGERGSLGKRAADCYVFCVHAERDREEANVLDASQWEFYVVSTELLNEKLEKQKTAALSTIQYLTEPVTYAGLSTRVDDVLGQ